MTRKRGEIVSKKKSSKVTKPAVMPQQQVEMKALEVDTPSEQITDVAQGVINQAVSDADNLSQLQVTAFTSRLVENMPTVIGSMHAAADAVFGGLTAAVNEACDIAVNNVSEPLSLDLGIDTPFMIEGEVDGEGQV